MSGAQRGCTAWGTALLTHCCACVRVQNHHKPEGALARLRESPARCAYPSDAAVVTLAPRLTSRVFLSPQIVLDSSPGYLENDDDTVHVGFIGSFGAKVVSPRSLVASFLAQMVCLEGIVTKCSLVRPKMVRSVHYCPDTKKFSTREYRDATDWGGQGPTGTTYPTKDADGNPLQMEFGLSRYKANQVVTIQEMPERAPLGQLPRSVDVLLNHDLVDACKPGDRVSIVGVYRALAGQSGSTSGMFRTVLLANSVRLLSKDIQGMQLSEEDIKNIRQVGKAKGKSETAFGA